MIEFIVYALPWVLLFFIGRFLLRKLGGIMVSGAEKADKIDAKRRKRKRRAAIDKTERGKNRTALRAVMRRFILEKGGLGYVYADYAHKNTSSSFDFYNNTGQRFSFVYHAYGFGDVSAEAAMDIFERLAEELGGKFNPYYESFGGGGGGGYMGYGDVNGDIHIVPGSSGSGSSRLKNIGIYTNESWKKIQDQKNKENTRYKSV